MLHRNCIALQTITHTPIGPHQDQIHHESTKAQNEVKKYAFFVFLVHISIYAVLILRLVPMREMETSKFRSAPHKPFKLITSLKECVSVCVCAIWSSGSKLYHCTAFHRLRYNPRTFITSILLQFLLVLSPISVQFHLFCLHFDSPFFSDRFHSWCIVFSE